MSRNLFLCLLLGGVVALGMESAARSAPPAVGYYLKIRGIEGDAADGGIALAGFAWNTVADVGRFEVLSPRDAASGMASGRQGVQSPRDAASGQATGRRMHKPMTIVKEWGPASAKLMQACVDGTHIGDVEVWSREGGQATLRYTLQDAIISSYSLSRLTGSDGGVGDLTETISFSFDKVEATAAAAEAANLNLSKSSID